MAEYQFVDELVKEYLTFRGFTTTLKYFEVDLKNEKEKGFRVDRVVESLNQCISSYDLAALLDNWKHFENHIFSKIDPSKASSVRKLESSLLKLYLINCIQNRQSEKVKQFFEKMTPELQNANEWKDWFALPYIKDPQENQTFLLYFTRNWQDTVMISLHNFLMICFQSLPPPRLADCQKTAARIKYLKEEIRDLKLKLAKAGYDQDNQISTGNLKYMQAPPSQDIMDDFFLIAQETEKRDTQIRSIKSFLKTFTGQKKSPSSLPNNNSSQQLSTTASSTATTSISTAKPKQPISVNKAPLKRISPSVGKLSLTSVTSTAPAPHPPRESVREEVLTEQGNEEDMQNSDSKDTKSVVPRTSTFDLLATPGTPGNQLLLLGQEEYHEHRSSVVKLEVSTAGYVASADVSGVIKIWKPEASSHPTTAATFISGSPVSCLVWLDERRLLYGTNKGQVRMCDSVEKCLIQESGTTPLTGQPISVLSSSPCENLFLAASTNSVVILSSKTLSVEKVLDVPEVRNLTSAVYNHNGALVIFSTSLGVVGIYDLHRNEVLASWQGHDKPIVTLQLTPDETSVWSLDKAGNFLQSSLLRPGTKLWRGTMPTMDCELVGEFALSPTGDHVLVGSATGAIVYRIDNADNEGEGDSALPGTTGLGATGGLTDASPPKRGQLVKVLGMKAETTITTVHWSSGDCGILLAGGMDGSIKISTLLHQ
eukprot:TRINITY_DN7959_c2_g1_i2.p1 TRINITY_DN7959_c2_g1~~TRINITY_DN7959_c2_g1_i2.p1  ORF type:complete len:710 (-),score=131.14 TRINITY_DN7959_c2_g1_i2:81-2210(-)